MTFWPHAKWLILGALSLYVAALRVFSVLLIIAFLVDQLPIAALVPLVHAPLWLSPAVHIVRP